MNTTDKRFYVVKINMPNQFPTEIFQSEDLKKAFDYFNTLNVEDLEDDSFEYELAPYNEEGLTDWHEDELMSINQPVNEWVVKSK